MGFNEATRQNIRGAGSFAYAAGSPSTFALPRVGYLAKIHVLVSGTMTVTPGTGTATLSKKAPWNLFRRIRYEIGSGTAVWNTSGYGAFLVDHISKLAYDPRYGGPVTTDNAGTAAKVYQCGVASGDNQWNFGYTIEVTPNERDIFGLILLQAEGTATQILGEWQNGGGPTNDFPVVLTGNATATFNNGKADVYLETFTVPATVENQPPLDKVYQTVERVDPIFATGDNSIKLLQENTYSRILQAVEINGALNDDAIEKRILRYNITDSPYEIPDNLALYLQRKIYNQDMPAGVRVYDFFNQGYPNYGGDRDMVDAHGLAEFETIVTIASGATLGSNNNVIRTIQQQIVQVSAPPVAPGASA